MEKQSIEDMFKTMYKINFDEKESFALKAVLNGQNINNGNCKIEVQSNLDNFVNSLHLFKKVHLTKLSTNIIYESVVYAKHPVQIGEIIDIHTSFPSSKVYKDESCANVDRIYTENVVIIKSTEFDSRKHSGIKEHFVILVYNKNLDVRANGIIFEDLP